MEPAKRIRLSVSGDEEKENASSTVGSASSTKEAPVFHVLLKLKPKMSKKKVAESVNDFLRVTASQHLTNWTQLLLSPELLEVVDHGILGCTSSTERSEQFFDPLERVWKTHLYSLNDEGPLVQSVAADDDSQATAGSILWQLPCAEFDDIWSTLYFDDDLKTEVLSYVLSLMELSDRGVNSSIVSVNRLILLQGPPGTGKTSVCKAVAQLSSILLSARFPRAALIEVNSHSLFSKWFSESGKLVARLFEQAEEMAEDEGTLLFLLIDEAESLCTSRSRSMTGSDPADSVRAVNALLTQLDKLRRRKNVFVLCTSNLADSLDAALLDRADLSRVVQLPGRKALAAIYLSCLQELRRIGVFAEDTGLTEAATVLADLSCGLSCRAVRQIPAVAYARAKTFTMPLVRLVDLMRDSIKEKKAEPGRHV